MRLIDADELYKQAKSGLYDIKIPGYTDNVVARCMADLIKYSPKIYGVPVIRCASCKYLGHVRDFTNLKIDSFQCERTNTNVRLDDFCSYGGLEESE